MGRRRIKQAIKQLQEAGGRRQINNFRKRKLRQEGKELDDGVIRDRKGEGGKALDTDRG